MQLELPASTTSFWELLSLTLVHSTIPSCTSLTHFLWLFMIQQFNQLLFVLVSFQL